MRLAILDLHRGGGHHFAYLRAIVQEAKKRQWKLVIVLSREATQHSGFAGIRSEFYENCELIVLDGLPPQSSFESKNWLVRQFLLYAEAKRFYRAAYQGGCIPDAVHHIDCDGWMASSALLGSPTTPTPSAAVSFGVRYHRKSAGISSEMTWPKAILQKWIFECFLRRGGVTSLLVPDDSLAGYLQSRGKRIADKVHYFPDICDLPRLADKAEARIALGIPKDAHVILCFGALSLRKGITELLAAASNRRCPRSITVLLGGEQGADLKEVLAGSIAQQLVREHRLFVVNGFLDESQMSVVFGAADSAWLAYSNFEGSSGFLWQAARAGLPIVGCKVGMIGYWTKRSNLGPVVDPQNIDEVINAFETLTSNLKIRKCWIANCLAESSGHSREAFAWNVCNALASLTEHGGVRDTGDRLSEGHQKFS